MNHFFQFVDFFFLNYIIRRNASTCWQAMIDEDRLLNRIDVLESKLKFLQKNAPDDELKDEILKLQEDKCLYQVRLKYFFFTN